MSLIDALEELERAEPRQLVAALLQDGIEILHTVGLLREEIEENAGDDVDVKISLGYMQDELERFRKLLTAASINQELHNYKEDPQPEFDSEGNIMKQVFVIEKEDNVGTSVGEPIKKGDEVGTVGRVTDLTLTSTADIPYGHKIALKDIPKGDTILKYGLSIGNALDDIKAGDHVHTHNVESNRGRGDKSDADPTKSI